MRTGRKQYSYCRVYVAQQPTQKPEKEPSDFSRPRSMCGTSTTRRCVTRLLRDQRTPFGGVTAIFSRPFGGDQCHEWIMRQKERKKQRKYERRHTSNHSWGPSVLPMLNKPSLSPRTMLANCDGPFREKKGCLHHPHPSQGCDLRARRWSSVSNAQIFAPDKIIRTQPHPNVLHNQMIISFFFWKWKMIISIAPWRWHAKNRPNGWDRPYLDPDPCKNRTCKLA